MKKELSHNLKNDRYQYSFSWLGRKIIQFPQDIVALQEIIVATKPDCIIETGVAYGGSLLLYASLLQVIRPDGLVIGIDKALRDDTYQALTDSPLTHFFTLIEGDSTNKAVVQKVIQIAQTKKSVMVILDSDHSYDHVKKELASYAPLVSKGNYCVVGDTIIGSMPEGSFRKWDQSNNPARAVEEFLQENRQFVVDGALEERLQITANPGGYLKRVD